MDRLLTAMICLFAAVAVSPIVIAVLRSLSGGSVAYLDFFLWNPQYVKGLSNSIITSCAASVGAIVIAVPAAYVFSKVDFRGRDLLFYSYIILMMMPFQVTLLPQYIVSRSTGIYDTLFAIILPGIFSPFPVFLLTQMMKSIPAELTEAVRLDTNSTLCVITKVIVPSVRPGIICAWTLTFTEIWNMVAEPLVLIETREKYPLAVILSEIDRGDVLGFAAACIFLLLPLLIFMFFEEEILEGLEAYKMK